MGNVSSSVALKPTSVMRGHKNTALCVTFSPTDPDLVASGSRDSTIKLWSIQLGTYTRSLKGHTGAVNTVTFLTNDPDSVASGSSDNTIRIWSVRTGECSRIVTGSDALVTKGIFSLCSSPTDGEILASTCGDSVVRLWNLSRGSVSTSSLVGHTAKVNSVAFNMADSNVLVSGGMDSVVRIWDVAAASCKNKLIGHTGPVCVVTVCPSGLTIASGSRDKTIRIWTISSGECTLNISAHKDWVIDLCFSPANRSVLASTGDDNIILLWSLQTGYPSHRLAGSTKYIETVQFSPLDGETIVAGTDVGYLLTWKVPGITNSDNPQDLPPSGPFINMIARKRVAEAMVINTEMKLELHRKKSDPEVAQLRSTLKSLMNKVATARENHQEYIRTLQQNLSPGHDVSLIRLRTNSQSSSRALSTHSDSDISQHYFSDDERIAGSPLDRSLVDYAGIDTPSHLRALDDELRESRVLSSSSLARAESASPMTSPSDLIIAQENGIDLSSKIQRKLLRFQAIVNRRMDTIARELADLSDALQQARSELETVNQEIAEFTEKIKTSGFDELDTNDVYELLTILGAPVSLPSLRSHRVCGLNLLDVTDSELDEKFGIKALGDRIRLRVKLRELLLHHNIIKDIPSSDEDREDNVDHWGVERTAAWLESQHIPITSLLTSFRAQKIDGRCLPHIKENDLEMMGAYTDGCKTTILRAIRRLLENPDDVKAHRVIQEEPT